MKNVAYTLIFLFWAIFTVGGAAYLVFWRGRSPWWMLVGIILASSLRISDTDKK